MFLDSKRIVALLLACPLFAQTAAQSSKVDATGSVVGQAVIAIARERAAAFEKGDCQKWASYLDPDFHDIEGNGTTGVEKLVQECEQFKTLPQYRMQRILSDFHVTLIGQTVAVLDYHYDVRETFGSVVLSDPHRQIDIYEKRDGRWVGVQAVSAIEVTDPPAAEMSGAQLDPYVGEYRWVGAPMVDKVTRKGDKLFIQATGDLEPTELVPESAGTFFIRGQLARVSFVRDKNGSVTEENAFSPTDHQGYHAKRVK